MGTSEPAWQPNYIDLSDSETMRLGAECAICGARYTTSVEPIDPMLVTAAVPDSPLERDLSELRFRFFVRFDAAFRDICVTCYRCGRPACPECWDEDNRMCGECVAQRGLVRSPRHGMPVTGPLVDGRLERVAPGKYGEAGRPEWLSQLLDAQSALVVVPASDSAAATSDASALPEGFIAPQIARRLSHGPAPADAAVAFDAQLRPSFGGEASGSVVEEETLRHAALEDLPHSGQRISGGPLPALESSDFVTPEGTATSNMVTCPRCGTANYDFVTRCSSCQLQLIQICPRCEKLNPGHVRTCEFCGTLMAQPKGWSGVQAAIQAVPPAAVREIHNGVRPTGAPTPKPTLPPVQRAPHSSRRLRARFGGAGIEGSAGVAPFEDAGESRMAGLTPFVERFVSFALAALILLLVGGVAAAELSSRANVFIESVIHINVRETIAQFVQNIQLLFQHHAH